MMHIKMNDVKFGDCFVLEEKESYLIVDCGSKNSDKTHGLTRETFPFKKIEPLLHLNPIMLITHFDYDHYNGILAMSDKYGNLLNAKYEKCFKEIILPYCFWLDGKVISGYKESIEQIGLIKTMVYLTLLTRYKKLINLSRLFSSIPYLVKDMQGVHCVKKGDIINFKQHNLNILWPSTYIKKTCNITKINQDLQNQVIEHMHNNEYMINNINETIIEFSNAFQNLYTYYSSPEERFDIPLEDITHRFHNTFNNIMRLSQSVTKINTENFSDAIINGRNAVIDGMNACSIVFDEKTIADKTGKILFLGDATPKVINMINNDFAKDYTIIKVQHHATNMYYCNIPKTKYGLISKNGYPNWPISKRQIDLIHAKGGKVLCTDIKECDCIYNKNTYTSCNSCASSGINITIV